MKGAHEPHYRSRSKDYRAWRAGKIKMFWCFKPVEEMGGRTAGRKDERTRAALSVHTKTPIYAYARSSLHPRPAIQRQ
jgi:hypothetical protein